MQKIVKRTFDLTLAITVALVLAPLLLLLAMLIRIDTRGPALFIQDRLGLDGKTFRMFKFRTMVENAEQMGTGLFSFENDPRVTRVGQFLRHTSLDELPQLFNVLRGEMSIVGPRPPVTYELGDYADFPPELKFRFTVKPGVTGLAQISGRNDLNWDHKIVYDTEYIRKFQTFGVAYDVYLIVRTIWVVLAMRNVIEKPSN